MPTYFNNCHIGDGTEYKCADEEQTLNYDFFHVMRRMKGSVLFFEINVFNVLKPAR